VANDWRGRLRESGHRITAQRELVYGAVVELEHATPDAILTAVQRSDPGVNLSTIYRNLDVLEDVGLVHHSHIGHGSPTYHPAEHALHLHLVCQACGAVDEVPTSVAEGLVGTVRERNGFTIDMEHFALQGTCRACMDRR
jgi:Fur family ferric uptake transcriptional regulator